MLLISTLHNLSLVGDVGHVYLDCLGFVGIQFAYGQACRKWGRLEGCEAPPNDYLPEAEKGLETQAEAEAHQYP